MLHLLLRTWARVGSDVEAPEVVHHARSVVDQIMSSYTRRHGKTRWADKSVTTAAHADEIRTLYPDAQFVCLYRHCMDVVYSILESSPWGFNRFSVADRVRPNVENVVEGLVTHWLEQTRAISRFEEAHPEQCWRIRYEDLTTSPESTLRIMSDWLDLDWNDGVLSSVFQHRSELGPGDQKLLFSEKVHTASIGRGARIPFHLSPPPQRNAMNQTLRGLNYPEVDFTWNGPSLLRQVFKVDGPLMESELLRHAVEAWCMRLNKYSWVAGSQVKTCTILVEDSRPLGGWVVNLREKSLTMAVPNVASGVAMVGRLRDLYSVTFGLVDPAVALDTGAIRVAAVDGETEDTRGEVRRLLRVICAG